MFRRYKVIIKFDFKTRCRNLIEDFKNAGTDFTIKNKDNFTVMQVVFSKKVNETSPFEDADL